MQRAVIGSFATSRHWIGVSNVGFVMYSGCKVLSPLRAGASFLYASATYLSLQFRLYHHLFRGGSYIVVTRSLSGFARYSHHRVHRIQELLQCPSRNKAAYRRVI